jgi:hypothetical protein
MTAAVLAGSISVVIPWLWRWFRPAQDWYLLLISCQVLGYAFWAPFFTSTNESAAIRDGYAAVMWQVAMAFTFPLYASYRHRRSVEDSSASPSPRSIWTTDRARLRLWAAGTCALAASYLWVAITNGLLFRRIGHAELAAEQLNLSPLELAPYRLFLILGPWCVAVLLVCVRSLRSDYRRDMRFTWAAVAFAGGIFAVHSFLNSRLTVLLTAAFTAGLFTNSRLSRWLGSPFRKFLLSFIAIAGSFYVIGIVENVRWEFAAGRSLANPHILIPGSLRSSTALESRSERLDGLAVIVKIRPMVEREGPSYGVAWGIPLIAALDPIFPSELGKRLKSAALTSSKSVLLLIYAGEAAVDASSSMLTDAYGNFGVLGFTFAGIVLGIVLGTAVNFLRLPKHGWQPVVGLFLIWHVFSFEQEFGTVLFGWLKLIPVVVCGALLTPLTRAKDANRIAL